MPSTHAVECKVKKMELIAENARGRTKRKSQGDDSETTDEWQATGFHAFHKHAVARKVEKMEWLHETKKSRR